MKRPTDRGNSDDQSNGREGKQSCKCGIELRKSQWKGVVANGFNKRGSEEPSESSEPLERSYIKRDTNHILL